MLLARPISGDCRLDPTPGLRALCPQCLEPVRAKCGTIVTWHWAHLADECDSWTEPTTTWHRGWQLMVSRSYREVVMGNHRADIRTRNGTVIELQHSTIPTEEIALREAYYGPKMAWVFDCTDAASTGRLDLRDPRQDPSYRTFRWKHPRKSIGACRRPVFLDLGRSGLLRLGRIYTDSPCGGWGHLVGKLSMVEMLRCETL